jgi:non-ribosomal peptide synthetase component F
MQIIGGSIDGTVADRRWRSTGGPLTVAPATLPDVFATTARRDPAAVAVVFEDTEVSYAELDERANRLAHTLIARGVGPDRVVGLAVPRSIDMVVAELAVLKAGGAYLPLDPADPAERLAYMVGDARPACLVTTTEVAGRLPRFDDLPRLVLDDDNFAAELAAAPADDPARPGLRVESAAYVIYTSGSTGRPKGVLLTHAGVAKLLSTQFERFGLTPDVRVLHFASPSFDVAFWDLCLALLSGGRLVVVPRASSWPGPSGSHPSWSPAGPADGGCSTRTGRRKPPSTPPSVSVTPSRSTAPRSRSDARTPAPTRTCSTTVSSRSSRASPVSCTSPGPAWPGVTSTVPT